MTRMDIRRLPPTLAAHPLRVGVPLAISVVAALGATLMLARGGEAGPVLVAACAIGVALLAVLLGRNAGRQRARQAMLHDAAKDAARQATLLLRLSTLLQRCQDAAEVEGALHDMAPRLLPGSSGFLWLRVGDGCGDTRQTGWGAAVLPPFDSTRFTSCRALAQGRMAVSGGADHPCCGGIGPTLSIPIHVNGVAGGVLGIHPAGASRDVATQRIGLTMAEGISLALSNLALREALRAQALRDPLTGLHNRRFLEEAAPGLAQAMARRGAALSVAIMDIDHFKQLNDRHGHVVGDQVLSAFGQMLRARLRGSDVVCRYGGEEFLVLMPDCDATQARDRMDRLRRAIAGGLPQAGPFVPRVTCSIGIASVEAAEPVDHAIRRADQALYAAKAAGRNGVMVAPDGTLAVRSLTMVGEAA